MKDSKTVRTRLIKLIKQNVFESFWKMKSLPASSEVTHNQNREYIKEV